MPVPVKAVLFDHDGTLVDSEPAHFKMWQDVLRPYDVTLTEQDYRDNHAGIPTTQNAITLVNRHNLKVAPQALADAKDSATKDYLDRRAFPLMPGAMDAIVLLHRKGFRLAIVTGAGRSGVTATLRDYALSAYFDAVVSGDEVPHSKPAPDCYLLAADRLDLKPGECVAVEDTEHGVAAATAAGMRCAAVPSAMTRHHDFTRASHILAQFDQLTAWVNDQNQSLT